MHKIGVFGAGRGMSAMKFCVETHMLELVAICDKNEELLEETRKVLGDSITYYKSFDEFLLHDMDAVILANYATEHAPFAIKALQAGKHVLSECLPCQTMQEAVALVEAVEAFDRIYAYGENYCYMNGTYEMRKLYRAGRIGEFEYGEGEYIHCCEDWWASLTYGEPDHWRNNMYATFYCTHSLGPLIHITGLRPVSVVGLECKKTDRHANVGAKGGMFGMEMVTLENGAIVKSIHGGLYKHSIWYTLYGNKGRMETSREDAENGGVSRVHINTDEYPSGYGTGKRETYLVGAINPDLEGSGHNGGDAAMLYHFAKALNGDADAEIIDVYEAMDMFLPGMFAYRSVLQGGITVEIPNLRDKAVRDAYRNDTACTDPKVAGDMLLPCLSTGNPDIPDVVYQKMKEKNEYEFKNHLKAYAYGIHTVKENK